MPSDDPMTTLNKVLDIELMAHSFGFIDLNVCDREIFRQKRMVEGDQIILPESVLHRLDQFQVRRPYNFLISRGHRSLVVSVTEFSATDKLVYLPGWMMSYLALEEGDRLIVGSISIPRAKRVVLKAPADFLTVHNPKVVLEYHLRHRSCLSLGQELSFVYADEPYTLMVVELEPAEHVSTIDADLDFELRSDEPEPADPVKAVE